MDQWSMLFQVGLQTCHVDTKLVDTGFSPVWLSGVCSFRLGFKLTMWSNFSLVISTVSLLPKYPHSSTQFPPQSKPFPLSFVHSFSHFLFSFINSFIHFLLTFIHSFIHFLFVSFTFYSRVSTSSYVLFTFSATSTCSMVAELLLLTPPWRAPVSASSPRLPFWCCQNI